MYDQLQLGHGVVRWDWQRGRHFVKSGSIVSVSLVVVAGLRRLVFLHLGSRQVAMRAGEIQGLQAGAASIDHCSWMRSDLRA